ncbi:MAG: hypothetical protein CMH54_15815 [Myxococcales bacterium]|nr:hypothetical protein [Myxococcales bacterium]|tara:strand:+ start:755 stop:1336 length:582 start_codon:yes stop_codon:yes gene_type:complete
MSDTISRKDFLRSGWRQLFKPSDDGPEKKVPPPPPFLRPPGALPEAEFLETCEHCGECVEACHQDSIHVMPEALGEPMAGTPAIFPQIRPCFLCTDVPCVPVCPTGALQPIAVADIRLGTAVVDLNLCIAAKGETCDACVPACPFPGTAIRIDTTLSIPLVDPVHCTGCGMCVTACVAKPGAITIFPFEQVQV